MYSFKQLRGVQQHHIGQHEFLHFAQPDAVGHVVLEHVVQHVDDERGDHHDDHVLARRPQHIRHETLRDAARPVPPQGHEHAGHHRLDFKHKARLLVEPAVDVVQVGFVFLVVLDEEFRRVPVEPVLAPVRVFAREIHGRHDIGDDPVAKGLVGPHALVAQRGQAIADTRQQEQAWDVFKETARRYDPRVDGLRPHRQSDKHARHAQKREEPISKMPGRGLFHCFLYLGVDEIVTGFQPFVS